MCSVSFEKCKELADIIPMEIGRSFEGYEYIRVNLDRFVIFKARTTDTLILVRTDSCSEMEEFYKIVTGKKN